LLAAATVHAAPATVPAKIVPKAATTAVPKAAPAKATAPSSGFTGESGSFAGGITARGGVVYGASQGFRPLTMDLYLPKNSKPRTSPFPGIVFLHGGGWASGGARHSRSLFDLPAALASLAAKGFVVASVNYRLSGEAKFPASLQDAKSALRWLRGHADDYGLDATRVIVWGEDAGGHLAALTATSCGVTAFEPAGAGNANSAARLPSDCAEGAVIWSGFADLSALTDAPTQAALAAMLGCVASECAPGLAVAASPVSHVGNMTPPFMIQHGETDAIAPTATARDLADKLKSAGVPVELALYPGGHELNGEAALTKLAEFAAHLFPDKPMDVKAPVRPQKPPQKKSNAR